MINGAVVSPKNFGAAADGVTNDSSALQQMMNSLTEGQTVDFGGASYICDNVSLTTNRVTLQNGRLIASPTTDETPRLTITADFVTLDNLEFFTENSLLYTTVGGVDFKNCNGSKITNCRFIDCCRRSSDRTDGEAACWIFECTDTVFQGNIVTQGVFAEQLAVRNSKNTVIDGNYFEGNQDTYSAISVGYDDVVDRSAYAVVSNNTVKNYRTSCITINCPDVVVTGNVVQGSEEEQGINLGHTGIPTDRCIVSNNVVSDVFGSGIVLGPAKDTVVSGNLIDTTKNHGIEIVDSANVLIIGNAIRNTIHDGIAAQAGNGISIRNTKGYAAVKNNYLKDIDEHCIRIAGNVEAIEISDNTAINIHNFSGGLSGGRHFVNYENPNEPSEYFIVKDNVVRNDSTLVGPGANRGVNILNSVTSLDTTITNNDFSQVNNEDFFIESGPTPTYLDIRGNKNGDDRLSGEVTFFSGTTSLLVNNTNASVHNLPIIVYRDENGASRNVHLSSFENGSFTIEGDSSGGDALISYKVI